MESDDDDDGDLACWTYLANILDDESFSSDEVATVFQRAAPASNVGNDLTETSFSQLQLSDGLRTSEQVGQALPVSSDLVAWFENSWSGSEATTTASEATQQSGRPQPTNPSTIIQRSIEGFASADGMTAESAFTQPQGSIVPNTYLQMYQGTIGRSTGLAPRSLPIQTEQQYNLLLMQQYQFFRQGGTGQMFAQQQQASGLSSLLAQQPTPPPTQAPSAAAAPPQLLGRMFEHPTSPNVRSPIPTSGFNIVLPPPIYQTQHALPSTFAPIPFSSGVCGSGGSSCCGSSMRQPAALSTARPNTDSAQQFSQDHPRMTTLHGSPTGGQYMQSFGELNLENPTVEPKATEPAKIDPQLLANAIACGPHTPSATPKKRRGFSTNGPCSIIKPMTAYNYFFRDERCNIVQWTGEGLPPPVTDWSDDKQRTLLYEHWFVDPAKGRRLHRKTEGKLGFNEYVTERSIVLATQ
jgi:hypothetical protein